MSSHDGYRSTAAIAGHPLHPVLIAFPIAFLTALLATDIVYAATGDPFWLAASYWLCIWGLLSGAAAAVPGAVDFFTMPIVREHTPAWIHFLGNATVLLVTFVNAWLRWNDSPTVPWPWGIPLSAAAAALLAVTGWYGGELSYRHRIGVIPSKDHDSSHH